MKKFVFCVVSVLSLAFSVCTVVKAKADEVSLDNNVELKLLKNALVQQKQLNSLMAPVKSQSDLYEVSMQSSALDSLTEESKQRFITSIEFNEEGVSTYYYEDLEKELTPTQIYKILSLIGVQHNITMYRNARVESLQDTMLLNSGFSNMQKTIAGNEYSTSSYEIKDHMGYKCESRGTCVKDSGRICTSNC